MLIKLVLSQNFGNIIHSNAHKAQLNINFLTNCKNLAVFPEFINVYLPNVDEKDMYGIKKKL